MAYRHIPSINRFRGTQTLKSIQSQLKLTTQLRIPLPR